MRFEGRINEYPRVDEHEWFKYLCSNQRVIRLRSEFEIPGCTYFLAEVYGRFGDYCPGMNPLDVKEKDKDPEVRGEIEISSRLIDRLREDEQTLEQRLDDLKAYV